MNSEPIRVLGNIFPECGILGYTVPFCATCVGCWKDKVIVCSEDVNPKIRLLERFRYTRYMDGSPWIRGCFRGVALMLTRRIAAMSSFKALQLS
jgi:hypothetical protein